MGIEVPEEYGGAGMSAAAQHSQSLEAWLAHVPGLKVAMPASAYDAKGLIVGAIRDDNPTIVVLNKRMLGVKGHVPEEIYAIPFGVANVPALVGKDPARLAIPDMDSYIGVYRERRGLADFPDRAIYLA